MPSAYSVIMSRQKLRQLMGDSQKHEAVCHVVCTKHESSWDADSAWHACKSLEFSINNLIVAGLLNMLEVQSMANNSA